MEQQNKKPKGYPQNTSGGLWSQPKTKPTQPDYKGKIEVTRDLNGWLFAIFTHLYKLCHLLACNL